eukprot:Rmarinus@m.25715
MHIVLNLVGEIVVNYILDIFDIETTGGNISRKHKWGTGSPELVEYPVTLLLALVTVDGKGRPAISPESSRQVITPALGFCKNKYLGAVHNLFQQFAECPRLLGVGLHHVDYLLNVFVSSKLDITNQDLGWVIADEFACNSLDLLGPRGSEENRLSIRTNLAHNLADLWLEPHIQHAVS